MFKFSDLSMKELERGDTLRAAPCRSSPCIYYDRATLINAPFYHNC